MNEGAKRQPDWARVMTRFFYATCPEPIRQLWRDLHLFLKAVSSIEANRILSKCLLPEEWIPIRAKAVRRRYKALY